MSKSPYGTRASFPFVVMGALVLGCASAASTNANSAAGDAQTRWDDAFERLVAQNTVTKQLKLEYGEGPSSASKPPLVSLLQEELTRAVSALSKLEEPVYALAYQVTDRTEVNIGARDGALVHSKRESSRALDVDMRVGDYQLDQTKALPGEFERGGYRGVELLPLPSYETDGNAEGNGASRKGEARALTAESADATRNGVWIATNRAYDAARQRYQLVAQSKQRAQGREDRDKVPSFTPAEPIVRFEPTKPLTIAVAEWEHTLRRLSKLSLRYPRATNSEVTLDVSSEVRTLVNTDGVQTQVQQDRVRLSLSAGAIAKDGLPVGQFASFEAPSVDKLPKGDVLEAKFSEVLSDVERLLDAPLVDPYVGPAILDGRAAGVFFHEVFGHRIEGHRQDADNEGQTFSSRMGQHVMPTFLSIYDDPRVRSLNGVELSGFYTVDDEGVPGQRAELVEHGVLRGFLMSREPTRAVAHSNGHGRRSPGYQIVPRQANLIVEPERVVTLDALKQALILEVERAGLEYGLRFSEISGGYTQTARYDTQAFKVMPVLVYRVYKDGREELVRGVDIEGTPLTALSKIKLAADDFQVFNGVCGAESGWVPVSATSPSLLVSQIEVARQELTELRPPILPSPKKPKDGEERVKPRGKQLGGAL
jgi:TldD protein